MNPVSYLPASTRRKVYFAFGVISLAVGAAGSFFSGAHAETPTWLTGFASVVQYLGAGIGLMAGANAVDVEAKTDESSPTGASAGPSSDLPEGDPVEVVAPEPPVG